MAVLAQISDLHLDGTQRRTDRAAAVLDQLRALRTPVDAVLLSGDIADHGTPQEYAIARELIADLPYPVLVLPGNHDARAPFRQALLGGPATDDPVNQVEKLGDWTLLLADSTIPGRDDGYLADETLRWMDGVLGGLADDAPTLVCFHHPPTTLGGHLPDRLRQFGEHRLAEVLSRHAAPVALLCGHAHTAAVGTFAGLPMLTAGGVVSTVRFPWEPGEWLDYDAAVYWTFHVLGTDRRLDSHVRALAV